VTSRIKMAAAVLLVAAFLLPQYTCSMYHSPEGKIVASIPEGADPTRYAPFPERHYAWEGLSWRDASSWMAVVAFLWPLPMLAYGLRSRSQRVTRVSLWLEPVLVAGSTYLIWAISSIGQRAAGAYVGLSANGLYAIGCFQDLNARWRGRSRGQSRRTAG